MGQLTALVDKLTKEIPDLLVEHKVPGLAIGVCDAERILWSAGFGTTAVEGGHPAGTSTMFSGQSTSKMYTATAVMLAAAGGLVDLDQPVTAYLPEFTVNSRFEASPERRITLRHLLSHTAGLNHEAPVGSNTLVGRASFDEHCRSINDTWLRFPVGHHFEYSNLGIDLAGYILQRLSGLPFHEYVRRNLLEPLGLIRTTFHHRTIARDADRAIGHETGRKRPRLRMPMVAAGAVYVSIDDALRYIQFHLRGGEGVVDPDLLEQMYVPQFPRPGQELGYGLGIVQGEWKGHRILEHGGGGFGFLCDFRWIPSESVGVVLLTNADHHPLIKLPGGPDERLLEASTRRAPNPPRPLPPTVALSTNKMERFAGEYIGIGQTKATITRDGSDLTWEAPGEHRRLYPISVDELIGPDEPRIRLRILDDASGKPTYLQNVVNGFTRYRNDPTGTRPPTGPPVDPGWDGRYAIKTSGITEITIELRTENGISYLAYDQTRLRLDYHQPGIYYLCDGNVLNLTKDQPTIGNARLFRVNSPIPLG